MKSNLLNAVLMTGLLIVSAQSFADFNDQYPQQQGQTSVLQHDQQDHTSSSPFEDNTNNTPEPQNTSTHTNHNTGNSYHNTNSNHGGSSDDVPEDMD